MGQVLYINPASKEILEHTVRIGIDVGDIGIVMDNGRKSISYTTGNVIEVYLFKDKIVNLDTIFEFREDSMTLRELERRGLWNHLTPIMQDIKKLPEVKAVMEKALLNGYVPDRDIPEEAPQRIARRRGGVPVDKYCPTCDETVTQKMVFRVKVEGTYYPTEFNCPKCHADLAEEYRAAIEKARKEGKTVEGVFGMDSSLIV